MKLSDFYHADVCFCYFLIVLFTTFILRFVLSLFRALEFKFRDLERPDKESNEGDGESEYVRSLRFKKMPYFDRVFISFNGFSKKDPNPDLWYNTIIGTFELAVFPILMINDAWEIIGSWVGFKTIAQWNKWSAHRLIFNGYIIANLFMLTASYIIAVCYFKSQIKS